MSRHLPYYFIKNRMEEIDKEIEKLQRERKEYEDIIKDVADFKEKCVVNVYVVE